MTRWSRFWLISVALCLLCSILVAGVRSDMPKDARGYYKMLGVDPEALPEEIKRSWKKLVLKYHPDKFRQQSKEIQKEKEEQFKALSEAYFTLSDEDQRAAYDDLESKADWDSDDDDDDDEEAPPPPPPSRPRPQQPPPPRKEEKPVKKAKNDEKANAPEKELDLDEQKARQCNAKNGYLTLDNKTCHCYLGGFTCVRTGAAKPGCGDDYPNIFRPRCENCQCKKLCGQAKRWCGANSECTRVTIGKERRELCQCSQGHVRENLPHRDQQTFEEMQLFKCRKVDPKKDKCCNRHKDDDVNVWFPEDELHKGVITKKLKCPKERIDGDWHHVSMSDEDQTKKCRSWADVF